MSQRRLILIIAACFALSLFMFAPPITELQKYFAGQYYNPRTDDFLAQCKDPMTRDLESTTVAWRILPPLVCHLLRLPGKTPLAEPWLGAIVLVAYVGVLFRRRLDDWRFVAGGTLLFATTAAVLVTFRTPGINDSWVWLGLLVVAFGRASWAVPVACLLTPWVDERFLVGFPLAWLVGRYERGVAWDWPATLQSLWLLPYVAVRLWLGRNDYIAEQGNHLAMALYIPQVVSLIPMIPIGWWMGLRAAWLPFLYACWTTPRGRWALGAATLLVTLVNTIGLSYDLSRSITIVAPVFLLGCFEFARRSPSNAPRAILALGIANLFIPAQVIMDQSVETICTLPSEILRLYTGPLFKVRLLELSKYETNIRPTPEHFLGLSLNYYGNGQYEDCVRASEEALKLRPGFADAYNNIAAADLALGRWDESIRAAHEALRLRPDFPLARRNLRAAQSQEQFSAWEAAKEYLLKSFKDPAGASFGNEVSSGEDIKDSQNWARNTLPQSDGTFIVAIWVEAPNDKGVTTRFHFKISLRYLGEHRWEIIGKPVPSDR